MPSVLSFSAVFLALLGLFLLLQTGVAMSALGHAAPPTGAVTDPAALAYWRAAAFARLFGVSLLAFGMVLWHVKPLVRVTAERRIGIMLSAGFALVGLICLIQQVAIFGTPAGWAMALAFFGLATVAAVTALRSSSSAG
ncbi:MAG TPA: hypothetical protein VFT04_15175 [Gemmatimonadales bacterium]|nr:hypothetical protein [Gemmatimonadales bacterium]